MKVLHAPCNIGNQPWVLSRHERLLGVDSRLVVNYIAPPEEEADEIVSPLGWSSEQQMRNRLVTGLSAPLDYDVMHYYFGRTLMFWDDYEARNYLPFLDLEIARRLGRRIFFTLQGCDVRLAGESTVRNDFTPCKANACTLFDACISRVDDARRRFISGVLPSADRVFFLNPELGHFLGRGEFLPYSSFDIHAYEVMPPKPKGRPRIVHAPTNGSIKGTPAILAAVEALRGSYDFDFILIENMKHDQALREYQRADIVIDQVLAGWYGGFAVEAMAMGKPVMCYLREQDFHFVPAPMIAEMPIVNVRPDRVADDLAMVLERQDEWPDWSGRSRRYVERWHNPAAIAAAMVDVYRDVHAPFTLLDRVLGPAAHERPVGGQGVWPQH